MQVKYGLKTCLNNLAFGGLHFSVFTSGTEEQHMTSLGKLASQNNWLTTRKGCNTQPCGPSQLIAYQ